jgi:hypothetical protein
VAELASRILTQRIAATRARIRHLSCIATNPATKLHIQRAIDDLDDAARWTLRGGVDTWSDVAYSVAATVRLAEWRIRNIERALRVEGPHGLSDEVD